MKIIFFYHARIVGVEPESEGTDGQGEGNREGRPPVYAIRCGDYNAAMAAAASKPLFTQSPMPMPR